MNRMGMLVDLAHVSEQVMNQVLEISKAPIIFSHSSAYSVCPHKRNVPDYVLKKVVSGFKLVAGKILLACMWSLHLTQQKQQNSSIWPAKSKTDVVTVALQPGNRQFFAITICCQSLWCHWNCIWLYVIVPERQKRDRYGEFL